MGLARNQQYAQPVAYAADRDNGAVVLKREFSRARPGFEFDDVLAAMRDGNVDCCVLADGNGAGAGIVAIDADRDVGRAAAVAAEIVHAQNHLCVLPDDGKSGRVHHGKLAVAFILAAYDQRMQRRFDLRFLRRVVNFAVRYQDCTGYALWRHIGERRIECGKKLGAVVLAVVCVVTVVSRISRSFSPARRFLISASALFASAVRFSMPMLCERSTTTTATSLNGSRFSCTSSGLAIAKINAANASPRAHAPRARRTKP